MNKKEIDDIFNNLYPVGEERWIKVKYLDRDKAAKWLRVNTGIGSFTNEDKGIEVTAIGIRDDYMPQVEALIELKAEMVNWFYQYDQDVTEFF